MSALTQTDLEEDELERIQSVIKGFLALYEELFETRIQKLIFFTEVYCVVHYRRRMTHAEYRPYMYGAYSRHVSLALEKVRGIKRQRTVAYGERTTAYSLEGATDLEEGMEKILQKVNEAAKGKQTEELAQFSKDSWLFENTEYDHPMQFSEFAEALDEHPEIEEKLKDQLPEAANINEDESLISLSNYTEG